MNGFITNIEEETIKNTDYRRVLFTSHYSQLVLMSLKPGEEIGNEVHGLDQFIRIEQGQAEAIIDNGETKKQLQSDDIIIVPAGTWHNLVNNGEQDLKLYTLYSPPEHAFDTVQPTKADEEEDHFTGHTNV